MLQQSRARVNAAPSGASETNLYQSSTPSTGMDPECRISDCYTTLNITDHRDTCALDVELCENYNDVTSAIHQGTRSIKKYTYSLI